MKKMLIALTAAVLVLTLLCGQALAVSGDITTKTTKVYSDAAMTNYVGAIPAYTALVVRSYDNYADVLIDGKVCYISTSALLHRDVPAAYTATLKKGTRLYQCADSDANSCTLKNGSTVKLLKVKGDWALVQSTGKAGLYAFVKVSKLSDIKAK